MLKEDFEALSEILAQLCISNDENSWKFYPALTGEMFWISPKTAKWLAKYGIEITFCPKRKEEDEHILFELNPH